MATAAGGAPLGGHHACRHFVDIGHWRRTLWQRTARHSHRRTKRRWNPNIQKKRYWVPSLRRNVTLNLSAKGIKVIDARGIDAVVNELIARGEKI